MGLFAYTKTFIVNTAMPARRTPFTSGPQNWTRRIFEGVADAWDALASTDAGKGASQVGIEDAGGNFTSTTVEGALAELAAGGGGGGGGVWTQTGTVLSPTTSGDTVEVPGTFGNPAIGTSEVSGFATQLSPGAVKITDGFALVIDIESAAARLALKGDSGSAVTPTIRARDFDDSATTLELTVGGLTLNGGAGAAGEVLTSNGAGSAPTWQAASSGLGPTNKVHYVVQGGSYATIQAAIDAAADLDVIFVGPKTGGGSWGAATFSAGKRLVVIGMQAKYEEHAQIDSVTFSPSTGLNILLNTIYIRGLFINSDFSVTPGVTFGGTAPGRLRMQECYVYNSGASGTGVSSNNSGSGSSLHIDNCLIQSGNNVGVGVDHVQGYTLFKNGCEVSRYQYQVQCAAGTVEILNTILDGLAANEVIRISGGVVTCGYSTIKNATANSSGVNLTTAGAVFGMGDATFAIATGTGYCVNGVAGAFFLYGHITYSNSAAAAFNVKVKNTITSLPSTQAFTSSP